MYHLTKFSCDLKGEQASWRKTLTMSTKHKVI